jgi:uncharacterized Zn finger protein (UPF0148 family)
MKFCNICGCEIFTRDGDNTCRSCEDLQDANKARTLARQRAQRRANEAALRSCGLVKVRGALGGVYWE